VESAIPPFRNLSVGLTACETGPWRGRRGDGFGNGVVRGGRRGVSKTSVYEKDGLVDRPVNIWLCPRSGRDSIAKWLASRLNLEYKGL
jgi:hypothetical protein